MFDQELDMGKPTGSTQRQGQHRSGPPTAAQRSEPASRAGRLQALPRHAPRRSTGGAALTGPGEPQDLAHRERHERRHRTAPIRFLQDSAGCGRTVDVLGEVRQCQIGCPYPSAKRDQRRNSVEVQLSGQPLDVAVTRLTQTVQTASLGIWSIALVRPLSQT